MRFFVNDLASAMIWIVLATRRGGDFRGGGISRRDRWFGLEARSDFADFRDWWHREGKNEAGGEDLGTREEAEAAYDDWVQQGRPKVK
jgi:hypothetical protein